MSCMSFQGICRSQGDLNQQPDAVTVIRSVLNVVDCLHHYDIVHRDLKYACFPPFTYLTDLRTSSTTPMIPTVTSSSSTLACKSPSISTHPFDHPSLTDIRAVTKFSYFATTAGRSSTQSSGGWNNQDPSPRATQGAVKGPGSGRHYYLVQKNLLIVKKKCNFCDIQWKKKWKRAASGGWMGYIK